MNTTVGLFLRFEDDGQIRKYSNRSSSRAYSRSSQPNESEVSIGLLLQFHRKEKQSLRPYQTHRKCPPIKCVIERQPEIAVRLSKPEVFISATV